MVAAINLHLLGIGLRLQTQCQCHHLKTSVFQFTVWNSQDACIAVVSRGQTLFRTEGKVLGFGHRATCRPGI